MCLGQLTTSGGTIVLPVAGTIAWAVGCGTIGALGGGLGNSAKKAVELFIDWLTEKPKG
ncbi:MAG: hypothetical protein R2831_06810 [Chitinophagaceae bacterium]